MICSHRNPGTLEKCVQFESKVAFCVKQITFRRREVHLNETYIYTQCSNEFRVPALAIALRAMHFKSHLLVIHVASTCCALHFNSKQTNSILFVFPSKLSNYFWHFWPIQSQELMFNSFLFFRPGLFSLSR